MKKEALGFIDNLLTSNGINYEFGEWTSNIEYPYFVGEYQEEPSITEDGLQETTFILNGFTRGRWLDLELAKDTISKVMNTTSILSNGNGIVVEYENSLIIPTGEDELKRIQININVKEWRV